MLHSYLTAAALMVAMLAVAGCGSSKTASTQTAAATTTQSSTPSGTTSVATGEPLTIQSGTPLSHAKWIATGDAICARANTKLNSTVMRTEQDFARVLPQSAGYDRVEATELSKLVPPAAFASDWKQIVVGIQRFGEYTAQVAEYAQTKNLKAAPPITQTAETLHARLAAIAKRDGFKQCSQI